ncbi:MAG: hypothetical protein LUH07_07005 [Lachnospiraceae bacterium]|nr:hypothetical protein [Lachnospiraceae bacterium]
MKKNKNAKGLLFTTLGLSLFLNVTAAADSPAYAYSHRNRTQVVGVTLNSYSSLESSFFSYTGTDFLEICQDGYLCQNITSFTTDESGTEVEKIQDFQHLFDENGNEVLCILSYGSGYSYDGGIRALEEYSYDESGNRISTKGGSFSKGPNGESFWYSREYDDNENLTGMEYGYCYTDETELYEAVYEYDDNKNLLNIYSCASSGEVASYTEFEYDEEGTLIKETWYDSNADESAEYIIEYEYDENGNCIQRLFYESGYEVPYEYYYEYDEDGHLIRSSKNGGSADYTYTYDENGNLVSITGSSSADNTVYEYDSAGNLIRSISYISGEEVSRTEYEVQSIDDCRSSSKIYADVSEYTDDYAQLIDSLEMEEYQEIEEYQDQDTDAAYTASDEFYLFVSGDTYLMANSKASNIGVYGILLGEDINYAKNILLANDWETDYVDETEYDAILTTDEDTFFLAFTLDENGYIENWIFSNSDL